MRSHAGGPAYPSPPGAPILWPAIYLITTCSVAIGLYATSQPGWDLGLALVAGVACWTISAMWVFSFVSVVARLVHRMSNATLARWIGIPLLGYVSLALVFFDVPATVRFDLSRPAMEQAADDLKAGDSPQPGWIGLMHIDGLRLDADGTTILTVQSFVRGGAYCGFAYNPERTPIEGTYVLGRRLADGWWTWCDAYLD